MMLSLLIKTCEGSGVFVQLTQLGLRLLRHRHRIIPFLIFILAALLSALGIGNIATTALVAPPALAIAASLNLSPFLMVLMIVGGANASVMSPLSPTGILAQQILSRFQDTNLNLSLGGWKLFWPCFAFIAFVHLCGFLLLGGSRWLRSNKNNYDSRIYKEIKVVHEETSKGVWTVSHYCALVVLALFFALNLFIDQQIWAIALFCVIIASFLKVSSLKKAFKGVPWRFLIFICAITTALTLVEKTLGFEFVTQLASQIKNQWALMMALSFSTALLSVFSSSSGVVMPLFLPMIPALVASGDAISPVFLMTLIVVSSHLVDCSPFSSLGAIAIASLKKEKPDTVKLFHQLLIWGLIMAPVAALLCAILEAIFV